jgi:hypothetical protein
MGTNIYMISGIILFLVIISIMHFWSSNYYKNNKFKTFLTFVTTITSILFSTAIIIQVFNFNHTKDNEEIIKYNETSKILLDDTIHLFIEHPEMNYYYNDLLGIKKIDQNTKRNLVLENQISMLIFARIAKFAMVVNESDDEEITKKLNIWMGHVIETFMKSDTFRNYWINEYKPKLSGPAARIYMKKYFNL